MAAGGYAGGWSFLLFLGFLRGCDNRASGLSMAAIIPAATCVSAPGIELVVPQQRLDDADIDAALEQMGREAVAQRVQRHALLDPGRGGGRLMEQAAQLAVVVGLPGLRPGNSQRSSMGVLAS